MAQRELKAQVSSAGGLYSSGPQTLMCKQVIQLVAVQISQFCSQRSAGLVGFEVGPGICIKCANLQVLMEVAFGSTLGLSPTSVLLGEHGG